MGGGPPAPDGARGPGPDRIPFDIGGGPRPTGPGPDLGPLYIAPFGPPGAEGMRGMGGGC